MNDSARLFKIIRLIQEQYTEMYNCSKEDTEYVSLDGTGCNATEALMAFEPIYRKTMHIVQKENGRRHKGKRNNRRKECMCPEKEDGLHLPNCTWTKDLG